MKQGIYSYYPFPSLSLSLVRMKKEEVSVLFHEFFYLMVREFDQIIKRFGLLVVD